MQAESPPVKQVRAELPRSKWIRVDETLNAYPLRRSILFRVLRSGKINTFILKDGTANRGIRLIDRESLDRYLQEEADRQ